MKNIKLLMVSFIIMISMVGCKSNDKVNDDQMKEDEIQDSNSIQEDETASGLMAEFGTVQSIDLDAKQITITRGESDEDVLVLNIDEDTYYVDSVSGEVLDKSTLKEGDAIVAWVFDNYTASIPQQANAKMILNDDPSIVLPVLTEVKAIENKDEYLIIKTNDELTTFVIENTTVLTDLLGKMDASSDDIKEGAYCLVWIKNTDEFFEENGIFVEKVAIVK